MDFPAAGGPLCVVILVAIVGGVVAYAAGGSRTASWTRQLS